MQIEAIYDNGRLVFKQPITFNRSRFKVRVEIAEDDVRTMPVEEAQTPPAQPGSLQEELNRILGSAARQRPEPSIEEDRAQLIRILEEKNNGN